MLFEPIVPDFIKIIKEVAKPITMGPSIMPVYKTCISCGLRFTVKNPFIGKCPRCGSVGV